MIDKKVIYEEVILDNIEKVKNIKIVKRDINISLLQNKIKAIYGVRRSGKTYFLFQIISSSYKDDFIYINFEDERLINITIDELNDFLKIALSIKNTKNLFFDEIQNINNWELFIRRLNDEGYNLFVTGSSSKLLSKEIATSLRGRSLSREIFPLNFKEFLKFNNIECNLQLSTAEKSKMLSYVNNFFKFGGFPELVFLNDDLKKEILKEYLEGIFYRDIVERYNIRNIKELRVLRNILINLYSNEISIKKITFFLKEYNTKISRESIYTYMSYFEDAYLIFSLENFSYKSKIKPNSKLYVIDGAWNFSLSVDKNKGKILENMVLLELRKYGFVENENLFYCKGRNYEVDFLIEREDGSQELFQVCYELNEMNKEREFGAFKKAINDLKLKDTKLKIITHDDESFKRISIGNEEYIVEVIPFWKWCFLYNIDAQ
ncbi:MAG: ATP-binding protein [Methanosarcinales archaeon]|nr:ATP-binding protein [Methanosarcinales archaeon]